MNEVFGIFVLFFSLLFLCFRNTMTEAAAKRIALNTMRINGHRARFNLPPRLPSTGGLPVSVGTSFQPVNRDKFGLGLLGAAAVLGGGIYGAKKMWNKRKEAKAKQVGGQPPCIVPRQVISSDIGNAILPHLRGFERISVPTTTAIPVPVRSGAGYGKGLLAGLAGASLAGVGAGSYALYNKWKKDKRRPQQKGSGVVSRGIKGRILKCGNCRRRHRFKLLRGLRKGLMQCSNCGGLR